MSPSPASAAASAGVLAGKVAFVPGGTGVIGAAIARGLGAAGAQVVVGGTDEAKLRTVVDAVRGAGAVTAVQGLLVLCTAFVLAP